MPHDFLATAFQAAIAVEAILFGVLGFLYAVYAMYSSLITPAHPIRAPICNVLRSLCQVMAVLLSFSGLLACFSLSLIVPFGISTAGTLITIGLGLAILAMIGIAGWLVLHMEVVF